MDRHVQMPTGIARLPGRRPRGFPGDLGVPGDGGGTRGELHDGVVRILTHVVQLDALSVSRARGCQHAGVEVKAGQLHTAARTTRLRDRFHFPLNIR